MTLNIRNRTTEELAATLAGLTGETKTEAVTKALQDRLAKVRSRRPGRNLVEELEEIALHCASLPVLMAAVPMTFSATMNAVCRLDGYRHVGIDRDPPG